MSEARCTSLGLRKTLGISRNVFHRPVTLLKMEQTRLTWVWVAFITSHLLHPQWPPVQSSCQCPDQDPLGQRAPMVVREVRKVGNRCSGQKNKWQRHGHFGQCSVNHPSNVGEFI